MEKIKSILTGGHSSHDADHAADSKSPDTNAPHAFTSNDTNVTEGHTNLSKLGDHHQHRDTEIGADHAQGRHDPEVDAKEATSAAGNYPYWGDLPKEGEQQDLPDRVHDAVRTSSAQGTSLTHPVRQDHHKEEVAAATGVGAAGATYLATRNHEGDHQEKLAPAQDGPASASPGAFGTKHATSSTTPETFTNINDTAYAPRAEDNSHHAEGAALAAGAAGLGGAGILAHKQAADRHSSANDHIHDTQATPTTSGGIHNTVVGAGSREATHHHHPRTHKAAFNPSGLSASSHSNDSHDNAREQTSISSAHAPQHSGERNAQGLAAAAAVGAGAGAIANETTQRHYDEQRYEAKPEKEGHSLFGASHKHADKHHHHEEPKKETHSLFGASHKQPDNNKTQHEQHTAAQPAQAATAAAAAQHAWNAHTQPSSTTTTAATHDPENDAKKATSAAGNYPHFSSGNGQEQQDRSTTSGSAIGPAAGVGLAGTAAAAAYYGQGKEHDQSPRSGLSEKVAERALGDEVGPRAPEVDQGREAALGSSSSSNTPAATAAVSGGEGERDSARVIHKCHGCGADNDISEYFKKDAAFRMGS